MPYTATTTTVPDVVGAFLSYLKGPQGQLLRDVFPGVEITTKVPSFDEAEFKAPRPWLTIQQVPGFSVAGGLILKPRLDFRCYGTIDLNAVRLALALDSILVPPSMKDRSFTAANCHVYDVAEAFTMHALPPDEGWPLRLAGYVASIRRIRTDV